MRTTAVLVILFLVVGLNLGASFALAGDNPVIQPLPSACQPVSDVELSQIEGKFLAMDGCVKDFLCQAARNFWINKVPTKFKESCLGQKIKATYLKFCAPMKSDNFTSAPSLAASQ